MKKPCSEMFCLRNQDITDAKAFFYLFFMSNSGYLAQGWHFVGEFLHFRKAVAILAPHSLNMNAWSGFTARLELRIKNYDLLYSIYLTPHSSH